MAENRLANLKLGWGESLGIFAVRDQFDEGGGVDVLEAQVKFLLSFSPVSLSFAQLSLAAPKQIPADYSQDKEWVCEPFCRHFSTGKIG